MADAEKGSGKTTNLLIFYGLKEWAVAVEALQSGTLILLLRKGGIADPNRPFTCPATQVLLFPTYEHQTAGSVRTLLGAANIQQPDSGSNPDLTLCIRSWAQITHGAVVESLQILQTLTPFHIWTSEFIAERFRWRPQQPLQILCLRTYNLQAPIQLEPSPHYCGCRSWITLETPVSVDSHRPALTDAQYAEQISLIGSVLGQGSVSALDAYGS